MDVTLLEQHAKTGRKIRASGNGQCNIGNKEIHLSRFHSSNPLFAKAALEGYGWERVADFFSSIGLVLQEGREGKLFPLSLHAASVAELLTYAAEEAGVEIVYHCKVTTLEKQKSHFILESSLGTKKCTYLLIACGSPAAPRLGGNDSGYAFASGLGHSLVARYPSLVQLVSQEGWVKRCAGVKVEGNVTLYANGEYVAERKGDLLFTNYGISGLAILDISREVSLRLARFDYCELSLDLMPAFSKERLTNLLLKHITPQSKKPVTLWLQGFMHQKLVPIIMEHARSHIRYEGELNRKEINRFVHTLKNLKLSISHTRGFEGAEVSTGGIDTTEVDPYTMASNIVPGLYFAGEILDVDGDRGGFNFHFAWISGMRSGRAIAQKAICVSTTAKEPCHTP